MPENILSYFFMKKQPKLNELERKKRWFLTHNHYMDIYHMHHPIGGTIIRNKFIAYPYLTQQQISCKTGLPLKKIKYICKRVEQRLIEFAWDKNTYNNLYNKLDNKLGEN